MPIDANRKTAGLLVPVFALRHPEDLGIGDTRSMHGAIDFCASLGLTHLQVLPINETGGDNSPYNAISSVALAPELLSITPQEIPGLTTEILDESLSPEVRQSLRTDAVDYPKVKALKLQLLAAAFAEFESNDLENDTPLAKEFTAFVTDNEPWLPAYTLFRTLVNEYEGNATWIQWKPEHQSLDSALEWIEASPESDELERFRDFCAYVQWIAYRQWKAIRDYGDTKGVRLMGDMPFGVSRYGADVWAFRDLFDLTWSGGAPPEPFFDTDLFIKKWGQNWGIPVYKWEAHRSENFAWWRQRVRLLGACFHDFRIDHVLGFFRIYAFPWLPKDNETFVSLTPEQAKIATEGRLPQFLPGPDEPEKSAAINEAQGEELLRMVLEAAGAVGVVAEDLGVVPKYVRPLLQKLGIPGFTIPIFERISDENREFKPLKSYPALSLATYGTHDHAPLVNYYEDLVKRWHGRDGHQAWLDVQRLMRWLGLDDKNPPKIWSDALHGVFIKRLLETPCCMAIFMITDILGTTQRFNLPGSCNDSNWSLRLDLTLADYSRSPVYGARLALLKDAIIQTGRGRPS
jgi:4-alpha-glucanotransferase